MLRIAAPDLHVLYKLICACHKCSASRHQASVGATQFDALLFHSAVNLGKLMAFKTVSETEHAIDVSFQVNKKAKLSPCS